MKRKDDRSHIADLRLIDVSTATSYTFGRADGKHGDWAIATVNDATGELSVQSDWGSWSYRWSSNPDHLGAPNLTTFLADRSSADYVADKLTSGDGGRTARYEFDSRATVSALRRQLAERRLEDERFDRGPLSKVPARNLLDRRTARFVWRELGRLVGITDENDFATRYWEIDDVGEWVTGEPWAFFENSHTPSYLVLLHGIVPRLIEACAMRVESIRAMAVMAATEPS